MQKSLYDQEVYSECLQRIAKISAQTAPLWGKMNAAQTFAHCSEVLDVMMGKPLKGTPVFARLFKGLIRKGVFGPKPYRRSTPTHPQYLVTEQHDFADSKQALLEALARFHHMPEKKSENIIHPIFGKTTKAEKGWGMYKHLDHHLQQFGV